MKLIHSLAALAAVSIVSGCGLGNNLLTGPYNGSKAGDIDSSPGIDTTEIEAEGEADFLAAFQQVASENVTANMPNSGSADFIGGFGADVSGDAEGYMIGTLDMRVHDLNDGNVTGSVEDLTLYDGFGQEDRKYDGALLLSGDLSGNTLGATASGTIEDNSGTTSQSSNMSMTLDGDFRTINLDRAKGIAGIVDGSAAGDFAILLSDGKFYAVEQ